MRSARPAKRVDAAVALDVSQRQPSAEPGDSLLDDGPVPGRKEIGVDHEVGDAELTEMLQALLARKLRELGQ